MWLRGWLLGAIILASALAVFFWTRGQPVPEHARPRVALPAPTQGAPPAQEPGPDKAGSGTAAPEAGQETVVITDASSASGSPQAARAGSAPTVQGEEGDGELTEAEQKALKEAKAELAKREAQMEASATAAGPLAELEVQVLNLYGQPEPEAQVLLKGQWRESSRTRQTRQGPVQTNTHGKALFRGLRPGTYELNAGLPWGPSSTAATVLAKERANELPHLRMEVQLSPGAQAQVTLAPEPGAFWCRLECELRYADGNPAQGLEVWLARGDSPDWLDRIQTSTDGQGRVVFEALLPGTYKLQAMASAIAPPLATVQVQEALARVELLVPRWLPVQGKVMDAAGRPVPGLEVRVAADHGSDASGTTGPDGAFHTKPLPLGRVFINIEAEGYESYLDIAEHTGEVLEITLESGRELTISALLPPGIPDGTAFNYWLETPGSGSGGYGGEVEGGKLVLKIQNLPAGQGGALILRVGEFVPTRHAISTESRVLEIGPLVLEPGYSVHGRVEDPLGWHARGGYASVTARGSWFDGVHDGELAPDGSFRITGLPLEPITVQVHVGSPEVGDDRWLEAEVQVDPNALASGGDLGAMTLKLEEEQ